MKHEFNDKFEVPEGVDLEDELCKLGIVRLKYVSGNTKIRMVPRSKFIEDYYEEKCKTKAYWIHFSQNNELDLTLLFINWKPYSVLHTMY